MWRINSETWETIYVTTRWRWWWNNGKGSAIVCQANVYTYICDAKVKGAPRGRCYNSICIEVLLLWCVCLGSFVWDVRLACCVFLALQCALPEKWHVMKRLARSLYTIYVSKSKRISFNWWLLSNILLVRFVLQICVMKYAQNIYLQEFVGWHEEIEIYKT